MPTSTVTLFRPVGFNGLKLVALANYQAFPPRLVDQPIFYPVMNFEYAEQIARDWNTKSNSFAGFVTKFEVDNEYLQRFPVQVVGGRQHEELWVPAEELDEFNSHIIGKITVVASYYGEQFTGEVDPITNLPAGLYSTNHALKRTATRRGRHKPPLRGVKIDHFGSESREARLRSVFAV